MKKLLCGTAVLAATMLSACASSEDTGDLAEPLATVTEAIVNGAEDTTAHDAVVLVLLEPQGKILGSCTGTLVAPNLVLTARHCVSDTDEGVLCKADGTVYEGGTIKSDYAPSSLYIYPGLNAIHDAASPSKAAARGRTVITESTTVLCNHDVAFIVLDTDIDYPTAPLRTKTGAVQDESLTVVGWGLTDSGKLPTSRQARGGVAVAAAGPYVIDKATNIGLGDSEFAVRESICSGDSGGPAFSSQGAVVGVVSRGGGGGDSKTNQAASCIGSQVINEYTELAKKSALVTKAFAAAGYAPREEGTASGLPNGTACTTDAQCNSLECVAGTCVTRCDDATAAACGDGRACTDKATVKVCLTPPQVTALRAAEAGAASGSSSSSSGGCAVVTRASRSSTGGDVVLGGGLAIAIALGMRRRRRSGGLRPGDR